IMYADRETNSMRSALGETDRRRAIQLAYNVEHGIEAKSISKGVSDIGEFLQAESKVPLSRRSKIESEGMTPDQIEKAIIELEEEMLLAAEELRFEQAVKLRDEIRSLRLRLDVVQVTGR
ncbi:MAG: UvrB/UvrC motif-containing protein, partial [Solirubrobacterales bacterium]|nr:UvrB/UvrC motif-containing protein [Solirubrobacterales bacterium]